MQAEQLSGSSIYWAILGLNMKKISSTHDNLLKKDTNFKEKENI